MNVLVILALLGTGTVLAQPGHPDPFAYKGCATVNMSAFENPVLIASGELSPDSCLQACLGHKVAALFPELVCIYSTCSA